MLQSQCHLLPPLTSGHCCCPTSPQSELFLVASVQPVSIVRGGQWSVPSLSLSFSFFCQCSHHWQYDLRRSGHSECTVKFHRHCKRCRRCRGCCCCWNFLSKANVLSLLAHTHTHTLPCGSRRWRWERRRRRQREARQEEGEQRESKLKSRTAAAAVAAAADSTQPIALLQHSLSVCPPVAFDLWLASGLLHLGRLAFLLLFLSGSFHSFLWQTAEQQVKKLVQGELCQWERKKWKKVERKRKQKEDWVFPSGQRDDK